MKFIELSFLCLSLLATTAPRPFAAAAGTAAVTRSGSIRKRGAASSNQQRRRHRHRHRNLKGSKKASADDDGEEKEQASAESRASSQDDNSGDSKKRGPRYAKAPKSRDCKWKSKDDRVEFECKSKSDSTDTRQIHDKLKYKIGAKGEKSLKINVEYKQHIDDSEVEDDHTDTKTKYEIVFDRIVEYRKRSDTTDTDIATDTPTTDTDTPTTDTTIELSRSGGLNDQDEEEQDPNTQAYDWGEDEVLQEWAMEDWNDFSSVEVDPNGNLNTFSVSTKDEVVKFYFTIAQSDTGDITANRMKIDFELKKFEWMATDSYVALLCSIDSTRTIKVEYDDDDDKSQKASKGGKARRTTDVQIDFKEEATNTDQGDFDFVPFGEYKWKETAEVRSVDGTADDTDIVDVDVDLEQDDINGIVDDTSSTTNNSTAPDESPSPTPSTTEDNDESQNQSQSQSQTIQVIATSLENTNIIAFSFVGAAARSAQDIFWDPEAGVGFEDNNDSGGSMPLSMYGMVVSMTGSFLMAAAFAIL